MISQTLHIFRISLAPYRVSLQQRQLVSRLQLHISLHRANLPCKDTTLVLAAIFHKEAGRILRMTRGMITCHFDVLADLEAVAVIDLARQATSAAICNLAENLIHTFLVRPAT